MLRRFLMASALALAPGAIVLACTSVVIDGAKPERRAGPPKSAVLDGGKSAVPDGGACLAEGQACKTDGAPCCAGQFCSDTSYGYGSGYCEPLRSDGEYCQDGTACSSGLCFDGVCVDELPACVDIGEYCAGVAPCCTGYCLPYSYAPNAGTCAPLEPAGSACGYDSHCESGICEDYLCRDAACADTDAACFSDAECCAGFCTGGPYSYVPGACALPQPAGAYCESSLWCASMSCVESVCTP